MPKKWFEAEKNDWDLVEVRLFDDDAQEYQAIEITAEEALALATALTRVAAKILDQ